MKSKRAKEYVKTIKLNKANVDYCLEHGRVNGFLLIDIENAVELAERDAEEEVNHYRKELEESKRREELALNVIDDQRKKIEALKARAAEAFPEYMEQAHGGYLTSDLDNFLQKLNER